MIKILKSLFLSLAISFLIYGGSVMAEERDIIHMTLKDGVVKIETRPDLAPKHVAQIKQLISEGVLTWAAPDTSGKPFSDLRVRETF